MVNEGTHQPGGAPKAAPLWRRVLRVLGILLYALGLAGFFATSLRMITALPLGRDQFFSQSISIFELVLYGGWVAAAYVLIKCSGLGLSR